MTIRQGLLINICCFQGYIRHMRSNGFRAKAVGVAAISAVVLSYVIILVVGYVAPSFIVQGGPWKLLS